MIDILVPVLSRPQNAAKLVESIHSATRVPHTILFLCSKDDWEQIAACRDTDALVEIVPWHADLADYPRKMNYGFAMTSSEFVLMGADDIEFVKGWDVKVLEAAAASGAGVAGTNDCANRQVMRGDFSTHPLVRRSYVEELGGSLDGPGILVSEAYDHNYCDRELCGLAQHRELWVFAKDSLVQHRHPVWRTAALDTTYEKGKKNAHADHELFYLRAEEWGYSGLTQQEREWIKRSQRRRRRVMGRRTAR